MREPAGRTDVDAIWPPRRSRVDLGEAFASALASLRVAKLRSFLTVLGILIGVTTIVGMTSLVRGLDRSVTGSIESFGSTNLFLRKWGGRIVNSDREFRELEARPDITEEDVRVLARRIPTIAKMDLLLGTGPEQKQVTLRYRNNRADDRPVLGVP